MKYALILTIILIGLGASPAACDTWSERTERIQLLIDTGEDLASDASLPYYDQALELAAALREEYPDSARSHYLVALASGQKALFIGGKDMVRLAHEIKSAVDRCLEITPGDVDALLVRGSYYRELATLNGILKLFAKILYGGLPEGTLQDSHADLKLAYELDPDNVAVRHLFARTLYRLKEYPDALAMIADIESLPDVDHEDPRRKTEARKLRSKIKRKMKRRR
ncbi:MAG: hypothetical protein GY835_13275 [bacterium]|nr:hypothetical protein [bacterium]